MNETRIHTNGEEAKKGVGEKRIYCGHDEKALDEFFRFDLWEEAFKECGVSMEFYANRKREFDEILPWDMFDYGIRKDFLIEENKKAHESVTTPNCRQKCAACGAARLNGGKCDAKR